jgi:glucose 1-dehydrogenase
MTMTTTSEPFAGRVALVTGAAGGIGRAAVLALARGGADVAVNDLRASEATAALAAEVKALGRRALVVPADVSDQAAVEAMVGRVVTELGRLDLLVLSAVYSDREPFLTADMAGFRRTIEVSMMGPVYVLRAAANQMIRQGEGGGVVVISSPHARNAIPTCMAYNMAKAANDQMARTAALELLPQRIRVNIVYPGWTDTPGERKFFSEQDLRKAAAGLPMGRLVRTEEIARAITFLLDPASESITGTTLSVDGGTLLPWWSRRAKPGEF